MNRLEKALILGAAGVLAYRLVARRLATPSLEQYYHGKVAVVTGGASGIGRAIVSKLYQLGAEVLAVDLNADALDNLAYALPGIATLAIDLVEEEAPQRLLDEARTRFGRLDILFNNAGTIFAGPFLEMTDADIERLVSVNFVMQIRTTRTVLPYFLERGSGVIAYTGSMSAHVYAPMHSVYTGTKGGLHNFVASVRRELPKNSGVQLTIIQPNITRTNLIEQSRFDVAEKIVKIQTPNEVALALLSGIARGAREVLVRPSDHFYKWAERLIPAYIDSELRKFSELDQRKRIVEIETK